MLYADKDDVVRGLICRNYNIFVVNNGQGLCNLRIFEYKGCFCVQTKEQWKKGFMFLIHNYNRQTEIHT